MGDQYLHFDWAKSVERLYGDVLDEEFPEERVREMNAMVARYRSGIKRATIAEPLVTEPQRCQYCRQVSGNDARGGCVACGGPRPEYKPEPIEGSLVDWRI